MIFVQNDYTQYRYKCHNGVLQVMQRPITIADLTWSTSTKPEFHLADAREANFETKKDGLKLQDLRGILLQYNEPTTYVPRQDKIQ